MCYLALLWREYFEDSALTRCSDCCHRRHQWFLPLSPDTEYSFITPEHTFSYLLMPLEVFPEKCSCIKDSVGSLEVLCCRKFRSCFGHWCTVCSDTLPSKRRFFSFVLWLVLIFGATSTCLLRICQRYSLGMKKKLWNSLRFLWVLFLEQCSLLSQQTYLSFPAHVTKCWWY